MLSNRNSRAAHYQDFFVLPVDSSRMVRVAVGRRRCKYRELRAGGETGALVIVCIGLWPVHLCEKILLVRRPLMVAGARRWFFPRGALCTAPTCGGLLFLAWRRQGDEPR